MALSRLTDLSKHAFSPLMHVSCMCILNDVLKGASLLSICTTVGHVLRGSIHFSSGVLVWELFSGGKTPYPTFSNAQVLDEV